VFVKWRVKYARCTFIDKKTGEPEGTVPSGLVTARLDRYSLRDLGAALIQIVSPSCRFFTIHGLITSFLLHTFFEIVHGMACFRQSGVSEGLGTRAAVCASLPEMIQNTFFEWLASSKNLMHASLDSLQSLNRSFLLVATSSSASGSAGVSTSSTSNSSSSSPSSLINRYSSASVNAFSAWMRLVFGGVVRFPATLSSSVKLM
jgi:hypothetical protein